MARDAYSFPHFPMIAGVVLLAPGLKKVLEHIGTPITINSAALSGIEPYALAGGMVDYLLAHVAFKRLIVTTSPSTLVAAGVLVGPTPALRVVAIARIIRTSDDTTAQVVIEGND